MKLDTTLELYAPSEPMSQPATPARDTGAVSSRVAAAYGFVIAAVVISVLWFVRYPFPVGIAQDDGMYVILAKALAMGRGFRTINLPGAPAGVHFPPGYPLLLAGLWKLAPNFPANTVIFALANIVLLGVAAAGLFALCRRLGLAPQYAAICTLAGFLMPPALWMGTALLSEPLWLALTIWCLVWVEAAIDRPCSIRWRTAVAIGVSAGLIVLVRTQAVALIAGMVIVLAMRGHWRPALIAALTAAAVLLPWQVWVTQHAGELPPALAAKYGAYMPWFVEGIRQEGLHLIVATVRRNLESIAALFGAMFGPPRAVWIGVILIMAPFVAGIRRLTRRAPVTFIMLAMHAVIIVAWPFEPRRFVWTSWPFVTLWIGAGLHELLALLSRVSPQAPPRPWTTTWRIIRFAVIADGALLVTAATSVTGVMLWTGGFRSIAAGQARRIAPAVAWVQRHARSDAIIASDDEAAVFLYTGHLTVPTSTFSAAAYAGHVDASASVLDAVVAQYHPEIAVLSWKTTIDAAMRLSTGPHPVLRPVDRIDLGVVFERLGGARGETGRGTAAPAPP